MRHQGFHKSINSFTLYNGGPTIPQVHYYHDDIDVSARFCFSLGGSFKSTLEASLVILAPFKKVGDVKEQLAGSPTPQFAANAWKEPCPAAIGFVAPSSDIKCGLKTASRFAGGRGVKKRRVETCIRRYEQPESFKVT
jgi:hypothetical protein